MKKFYVVAGICIGAALLLIFFIAESPQRVQKGKASHIIAKNTSSGTNKGFAPEVSQDPGKARFEKNFGKFTEEEIAAKPFWVSWRQYSEFVAQLRVRATQESEIEFFGKVMDENGVPLSGVTLEAKIVYCPSIGEAVASENYGKRTKTLEMETDAEGRFEIRDQRGTSLRIQMLKKEKYKYATERNNWFFSFNSEDAEYSRHHPNPERPVEFVLEKYAP